MTGYPEFNYPAFREAKSQLLTHGHEVISPLDECAHLGDGAEWRDYMIANIPAVVDCDAIVLLDGWHKSKGARLEHHIALELGMKVLTIHEALA